MLKNEMTDAEKIEYLQARVHNLEVSVLILTEMLRTQEMEGWVEKLQLDLINASRPLGAFTDQSGAENFTPFPKPWRLP